MEFKTCSYCGIEVVPTADGECPSCRRPFRTLSEDNGPINPFAPVAEPSSFSPPEPYGTDDFENPYLPPKMVSQSVYAWPQVQSNRNLLWLLFSFRGRTRRLQFWGVSLLSVLAFYGVLIVAAGIFGFGANPHGEEPPAAFLFSLFAVEFVYFWIQLATQVKRWHDRDKSGWWVLIQLVPLLGPLIAFVELGCLPGTMGPNRYGPDPL